VDSLSFKGRRTPRRGRPPRPLLRRRAGRQLPHTRRRRPHRTDALRGVAEQCLL